MGGSGRFLVGDIKVLRNIAVYEWKYVFGFVWVCSAGVKFAPFSSLLYTPNPKTPKPLLEKGANLTFAVCCKAFC